MDIKDKLKEIFIRVLKIEDEALNVEELSYRDGGWDSVAHMLLVSEIENEFDIMVETDDLIGMSSFQKAVDMVEKYTA